VSEPITHHPAYKQGLVAKSLKDCPYKIGTNEYDLFERAFSQQLKRSAASAPTTSEFSDSFRMYQNDGFRYEDLKGSKRTKYPDPEYYNKYANAKKK
jgi:hypothetical protein